jgi:glycosyltransferase involved in cell wall biosynthesis
MEYKLMVSVNMISYKHEAYIAQAIEGVLMQETNFEYDLIIADDCSPDKTEEIVKNIIATHPKGHNIKYFRHEKNIGMQANALFAFHQCKGKYIAFCEGDDYWSDPHKLQRQVDFLEQNPSFSMCFHSVDMRYELKNDAFAYLQPKNSTLYFTDLLFTHMIATCSLVIRKEFVPVPYPNWIMGLVMGDIPIELLLVSKGPAHYFNETMAVYRRHSGGITQNIEQHKRGRKAYLTMYIELRKEVGVKYFLPLSLMVCKTYLGYLKDYLKFHKTIRDNT